jgi:hypothetical protein
MATSYPRPPSYQRASLRVASGVRAAVGRGETAVSSTRSAPRRRLAASRAIDWRSLLAALLFVAVVALESTVVLRAGPPLDAGGDFSNFP